MNIDSTVATLTGTQTLTNKTIASPTFTGDIAFNDASTPVFTIKDTTNNVQADWRATDTLSAIGTTTDNAFYLKQNGNFQVTINSNQIILNSSGEDRDTLIRDDSGATVFKVDAGTSKIHINSTLLLDSVNISAIQSSGESFADNDTSLMTSAAINDRIESFGYITTDTNTVTTNIAGTGINVSSGTGNSTISTDDSEIVHDNLSGFVSNEHINHTSVSILGGAGLTGGGTIAASRNIHVGAGTGITVNTDNVAINFKDEDDMSSNSATKLATQQSIKAYVDSVAQGLNVKTACAVATTANITLSGEQTIDGVATSTSRVLVKDQTDASENGVYVSASGAWSRATDFDNPQEVASSFIFIEGGTNYADTGWVCTNEPESVTVGTDDITFSQFSDAGHITAGTGLTKTGNTLSVDASQTQITSVGALDAGSITSNFGSIDNGSSTASFGSTTVSSLRVNSGTDNIAATFESTDAGSYINIIDNTSGTFGGLIGVVGDDIVFSPNNVERLRIDSSGNVGIGEPSPSNLLHLKGNASTTQIEVENSASAHGGIIVNKTDAYNYDPQIQLKDDGHTWTIKADRSVSDKLIINSSNAGDALSIDSSGNVGIGQEPDSRFHIKSAGNSSYPFKITNSANTNILAGIYQDAGGDSLLVLNISDGTQKVKLKADGDSYFNGGNVGIGTASPNYKLEINHTGANTTALVLNDANTVSNATGLYLRSTSEGRISFGSGADLTFAGNGGSSEKMRIKNSGNVGIGETSPASLLGLKGSSASATLGTAPGINLYNSGTTGDGHGSYIWFSHEKTTGKENSAAIYGLRGAGETDGDLQFAVRDNGSWVTAMHIDGAGGGNVGIGTDNPSSALHIVSSTATDPDVIIENTNADTNSANLMLRKSSASPADGDVVGTIRFQGDDSGGTETEYGTIYVASQDVTNGTEDGRMYFRLMSNGSLDSRLVIDGSNVGIGTTDPAHKLDIQPSGSNEKPIRINRASTSAEASILLATNDSNKWVFGTDNNTSEDFQIYSYGTASAVFNIDYSTGNVGIGTSSPSQLLHIQNSSGFAGAIIEGGSTSDAELEFHQHNSGNATWALGVDHSNSKAFSIAYSAAVGASLTTNNVLTIDSSGNVGIGTTSPVDKLQIDAPHSQLRLRDTDDGTFTQFSSSGNKLAIRQNSTSANHIWLTSSGEVGIGTASPNLAGFDDETVLTLYNGNDSDYSALELAGRQDDNSGPVGIIAFHSLDSSGNSVGRADIRGNSDGADQATELQFLTETSGGTLTTAMLIDSNQNVGIGTTSPDYQLDIENASHAIMRIHAGTNSSASLRLQNDAQHWDLNCQTGDNFAIYDQTAGTTRMTVDTSGNVGIGTTAPDALLTLDMGADDDNCLSLKSSDVAHTITDEQEADTYGILKKLHSTNGGLNVLGYGESKSGVRVRGVGTTEDSTRSTSSNAPVLLSARIKAPVTATSAALSADKNLVVIQNNSTTKFIFDSDGDAHADSSWTTFSDRRLKNNITSIPYGLNEVLQLSPKVYDKHSGYINNDSEHENYNDYDDGEVVLSQDSKRTIGFIAQDIKDVLPEIIKDVDESSSFYSMSNADIVPVLVKAIQELSARVAELESK